jgi:phenylalanyl-tRNA synthetase alpha chain
LSDSLHPLERRVLDALREKDEMSFDELVSKSALNPDQVRRALQWLSSKGMVRLVETAIAGMKVVHSPPELTLMEKLESPKAPTIESLKSQFASSEEFSAAFGRAKTAGWIKVEHGKVMQSGAGRAATLRALMESIASGVSEDVFTPEQRAIMSDLLKRGIVVRSERVATSVLITESGRAAAPAETGSQTIDRLTPEVLAARSWQGKTLRPIDVEAKAPVFFPGRRHPVRDFIREVRETYISMGFTELEGDSIYPAFWNFDALFIPQDHPGREMQDTFYLDGLSDRKLYRTGVVANVAATHENGWRTGSRGWGYGWRIEEARRLVLRTHNTVLTVKALSESKERESRVFAVSKVYRNENLDYKHLAEFHQMDGIIVGRGLNLRHLIGFLREFYKKLGMKDVKLWPTYFPYTEPSLEVIGYSGVAKAWIELSGSGVFRPEVTLPLGVKVPVLAWGPGIERLMLLRFGLDDMRALYGNDLGWLRNRVELSGGSG